jgi:ion channel-forming bestrophin family protein
MLIYEPNKNWFKDIRNLTTSWTIRKVLSGVIMIGILATLICFTLDYFAIVPRLHSGIFSLLGIVLSILLVFRTNTAYDRWWEGRKLWGELVNNTRSYAITLHSCIPQQDKESRSFFARFIASFCIALRDHLRSGVKPGELTDLSEDEQREMMDWQHIPNYIAYRLYQKMQTIYKAGAITDADMINLKPHHKALVDVLGACERIKKTPIPFSYAVYIKVFISLYGLMLPLGLYQDFGFYTIPLTMFIFFAMLGLELMAQEIEEPFGLDCNDLPTGDIANTIRKNVFEVLEEKSAKEPAPREIYSKVF